MSLRTKLFTGLALTLMLPVESCITKVAAPEDNTQEESGQVDRAYINFHAHWSNGAPAIANVYLYRAYSNKRLIAGGTNPNGNFYSLQTFPTDDLYQIFIQDIATRQCIDEVLVSFNSNVPWPRSERDKTDMQVNVGPKTPPRNLTGCKF